MKKSNKIILLIFFFVSTCLFGCSKEEAKEFSEDLAAAGVDQKMSSSKNKVVRGAGKANLTAATVKAVRQVKKKEEDRILNDAKVMTMAHFRIEGSLKNLHENVKKSQNKYSVSSLIIAEAIKQPGGDACRIFLADEKVVGIIEADEETEIKTFIFSFLTEKLLVGSAYNGVCKPSTDEFKNEMKIALCREIATKDGWSIGPSYDGEIYIYDKKNDITYIYSPTS